MNPQYKLNVSARLLIHIVGGMCFMNKQQEISNYLAKVKIATLEQIYDNVSFGYYHNGHKHLGEILSRMVKTKKIERVKKGLFRWIDTVEYLNNIKTVNDCGSLF